MYMHNVILFVFMFSATNSLSSGEVETIIICCSVFLVGFIIIVIILSIFGFVFKKKRLQAVQTLNNAHISSAHIRQETEPMFHCAQNKEVNYAERYTIHAHVQCICTINAGLWLYSLHNGL